VTADHAAAPAEAQNHPANRDNSITVSEADCFTMTGLVLFGARWKAPLARTLGVSRETVSRWTNSGDIPRWAINTVALLNTAKGSVLSLCDRTGNMVQPKANRRAEEEGIAAVVAKQR
jgi:hypothetical protein